MYFYCEFCPKYFQIENQLEKHKQTRHGTKSEVKENKSLTVSKRTTTYASESSLLARVEKYKDLLASKTRTAIHQDQFNDVENCQTDKAGTLNRASDSYPKSHLRNRLESLERLLNELYSTNQREAASQLNHDVDQPIQQYQNLHWKKKSQTDMKLVELDTAWTEFHEITSKSEELDDNKSRDNPSSDVIEKLNDLHSGRLLVAAKSAILPSRKRPLCKSGCISPCSHQGKRDTNTAIGQRCQRHQAFVRVGSNLDKRCCHCCRRCCCVCGRACGCGCIHHELDIDHYRAGDGEVFSSSSNMIKSTSSQTESQLYEEKRLTLDSEKQRPNLQSFRLNLTSKQKLASSSPTFKPSAPSPTSASPFFELKNDHQIEPQKMEEEKRVPKEHEIAELTLEEANSNMEEENEVDCIANDKLYTQERRSLDVSGLSSEQSISFTSSQRSPGEAIDASERSHSGNGQELISCGEAEKESHLGQEQLCHLKQNSPLLEGTDINIAPTYDLQQQQQQQFLQGHPKAGSVGVELSRPHVVNERNEEKSPLEEGEANVGASGSFESNKKQQKEKKGQQQMPEEEEEVQLSDDSQYGVCAAKENSGHDLVHTSPAAAAEGSSSSTSSDEIPVSNCSPTSIEQEVILQQQKVSLENEKTFGVSAREQSSLSSFDDDKSTSLKPEKTQATQNQQEELQQSKNNSSNTAADFSEHDVTAVVCSSKRELGTKLDPTSFSRSQIQEAPPSHPSDLAIKLDVVDLTSNDTRSFEKVAELIVQSFEGKGTGEEAGRHESCVGDEVATNISDDSHSSTAEDCFSNDITKNVLTESYVISDPSSAGQGKETTPIAVFELDRVDAIQELNDVEEKHSYDELGECLLENAQLDSPHDFNEDSKNVTSENDMENEQKNQLAIVKEQENQKSVVTTEAATTEEVDEVGSSHTTSNRSILIGTKQQDHSIIDSEEPTEADEEEGKEQELSRGLDEMPVARPSPMSPAAANKVLLPASGLKSILKLGKGGAKRRGSLELEQKSASFIQFQRTSTTATKTTNSTLSSSTTTSNNDNGNNNNTHDKDHDRMLIGKRAGWLNDHSNDNDVDDDGENSNQESMLKITPDQNVVPSGANRRRSFVRFSKDHQVHLLSPIPGFHDESEKDDDVEQEEEEKKAYEEQDG